MLEAFLCGVVDGGIEEDGWRGEREGVFGQGKATWEWQSCSLSRQAFRQRPFAVAEAA